LADKENTARPVLEALSWLAGIGGLVVGAAALVVAVRQGRRAPADAGTAVPVGAGPVSASGGGVVLQGDVTGGSGSGSTTGVHIGQVGDAPDPSWPAQR
jgi:hypothetical protein